MCALKTGTTRQSAAAGERLRGKRVVVEDSIVRGTTLRKLIRMIRGAGAAEVHVRVSSPSARCPCFYGIDVSNREELIASSHTVEGIRDFIGADSLKDLSRRATP
jgi:amidophosphoribosyltransferase